MTSMGNNYSNAISEQFQSTHQGQNIQFFRWIGDIHITDLAKQLNIHEDTLKEWELQAELLPEDLVKVANALGVDIKWLQRLTKIPTGNIFQNGDGNHNFLKNESVNVHYNPLETLKEFMTTSIIEIKDSHKETKEVLTERNKELKAEIEYLKEKIKNLEPK